MKFYEVEFRAVVTLVEQDMEKAALHAWTSQPLLWARRSLAKAAGEGRWPQFSYALGVGVLQAEPGLWWRH
jgi:hypothetical protein